MTAEQQARVDEFQSDFCALTAEEKSRASFWDWIQAYYKYCRYGPDDAERGGQNPGHKPPL